jgi:hypothetical protein
MKHIHVEKKRNTYRVLGGHLMERDHLGDPDVTGRIIRK